MSRVLIALVACLCLSSEAEAQPGTPCTPNQGSWTVGTSSVTYYVCASDGLSWLTVGSGAGGDTFVTLGSNQTNSTTSWADITGLSWSVAANTNYAIECYFLYNVDSVNSGTGVTFTGPASPTIATGGWLISNSAGTATMQLMTTYDTATPATSASTGLTTSNSGIFTGMLRNGSTAGTLIMRFRSEVTAASAFVVVAGSFCRYKTF